MKKNRASFSCRLELDGYTALEFTITVDVPDDVITEAITKELLEKGFEQVSKYSFKSK